MTKLVIVDEVETGFDELGMLFCYPCGSYWYGSKLTIGQTRDMVDHNNATILGAIT